MVKVYTRTGDDGSTHCFRQGRISKDDLLIEAIGEVDELNAAIGLLIAMLEQSVPKKQDSPAADSLPNPESIQATPQWIQLRSIQCRLFDVGGALATWSVEKQFDELVARIGETALEQWIDQMDLSLPEIREFILPGGSLDASQAHVCRTIARRAERQVVRLLRSWTNQPERVTAGLAKILRYLNRLSDYLFVLARTLNRNASCEEVFWKQQID